MKIEGIPSAPKFVHKDDIKYNTLYYSGTCNEVVVRVWGSSANIGLNFVSLSDTKRTWDNLTGDFPLQLTEIERPITIQSKE
jgi:hypothetical protein